MPYRLLYVMLLTMWCAIASSQALRLFNPEMKAVAPRSQVVVMDFLERYLAELPKYKQTTLENKMADDKVYFRKGQLSEICQITDSMPVSINLLDRYYEVTWMKTDEEPFVKIVFPAQYDLLLGMQKDEATRQFKEQLLAALPCKNDTVVPSHLEKMNDTLFCAKGDTLFLASLSDATYYLKKEDGYQPVFDSTLTEYSAANLLHGLFPDRDYRMYVEQSVYGMTTVNYTVMLSQWLNYCKEWGLNLFFAVEEVREDGILALMIARSKELGFHHLLSVVIPDKFIQDKNAVLKARLTPYIPVSNVKELYQKQSETHKRKKWY